MWLSGRKCLWGGPDDFLSAGLFQYVSGAPSVEFGYTNDALNATMTAAQSATSEASARAAWQKAQDLIASDVPTVPLLDVTQPAGAHDYVVGFVGSGLGSESLSSVWLNK
jgi:ABC-type oligopeptide transport system substrate-binding subunit